MPELPDVESFTDYFLQTSLDKEIATVEVRQPRMLEDVTPERLAYALQGGRFVSARRYGKYLLAEIDRGGWFFIHFGMTGYLKYFTDPDDEPAYVRLLIRFAGGGRLAYDNRRMIGWVGLADALGKFIERKNLGPDALAVDFANFHSRLMTGGKIKQALMDQSLIAGVGNEYSDEILFQMRMHPETPAKSLSAADFRKLYDIMREVLETAVASGADTDRMPKTYLLPHRGRKGRCPRCRSELRQLKTGGRTAYICPVCQPKEEIPSPPSKRAPRRRHPSP